MKVAIITNIPSPYRIDLFNYLIKTYKEFEFKIIYSSKNEDNRKWTIKSQSLLNSIFLKSVTMKIKKRNDNKYIHIPFNTMSVLNNFNPDVVVASEYNPTVLQSLIWCKLRKKKFISWSDGTLNSEKNINVIQKVSRKIIILGAVAYIASSTKTKEAQIFYGADEKKIYISYLTVDIDKYLYKKDTYNNYNLLYVGSLIKRKGIDLLFSALSKVKNDYKLMIIGEGSERKNLEKQAKKLGILEKIEFLGFKQEYELREYYKKCDIFILPTREDCFGLVVLEAMCNNLIIISSKYADGSKDLIKDGVNGYIVDPYDSIEFSNKIKTLINNKELCKNMIENNVNFLEKFTLKNVSLQFVNSIRFALNKL
ncbi:hypothetical protein UT300005_14980 [Clostridium sp. CTA-5]